MEQAPTVASIMTKEVITVDIAQELKDIHHIIEERKIRHIPVMDGESIVGIISKTDYLRLTFGTIYPDTEQTDDAIMELFQLEDLMVKDPMTIPSSTTIKAAAQIFVDHDFHALPVVDDGKLTGILSVVDVLKYLIEH